MTASADRDARVADLKRIDLMVLVADLDTESALRSLLARHAPLGIRPIRFDVRRHPERDPGCYLRAQDFADVFRAMAGHFLVVFDYHGSGAGDRQPAEIAADVRDRLSRAGWGDRCGAVVIDPELEAWMWPPSANTARILGWEHRGELVAWLQRPDRIAHTAHVVAAGALIWPPERAKPADPKEAYLQALRERRMKPSAWQFDEIGRRTTFRTCQDRAFWDLRELLRRWFPQDVGGAG